MEGCGCQGGGKLPEDMMSSAITVIKHLAARSPESSTGNTGFEGAEETGNMQMLRFVSLYLKRGWDVDCKVLAKCAQSF